MSAVPTMRTDVLKLSTLVALGLVLYFMGQCQGRASVHQPAVDSFRVAVRYSDSVEQEHAAEVAQLKKRVSSDSVSAAAWRREARRLEAAAQRQRLSSRHQSPPDTLGIAAATDSLLVSAYDSLSSAYDLMVRVDSLNQLQLAQKDSIIASQSQVIAALQRVRSTAIRAVESQQCKVLGLIRCPSRTTVGLVAAGVGFVGGYALGRH